MSPGFSQTPPASAPSPQATPAKARPRAEVRAARNWLSAKSWIYQLQHPNPSALEAADADLLVIDYSRDGSDAKAHSKETIARLKASGKLVVCYLSIGEAEPYRFYWKKGWRPGNPTWILSPNPDWPDNYPVLYWDSAWKRILKGYLDRILAQGFDGIYLDIVDGYEALERGHPQAKQRMIELVLSISQYMRKYAGSDFGVFPQNALGLLDHPAYRRTITGIGKEETWYFPGDEANPEEDRRWEENELAKLKAAGKLILTVDYPDSNEKKQEVARRSRELGFVPYLAGVELDRIFPQPKAESTSPEK